MTTQLTGLCLDHSFETAENLCRRCGVEFCELCLVYPFGAKKPLCKDCAMVAGGVRSHGTRPEMPRRDLKRRVKEWEARVAATAPAAEEATLSDPLSAESPTLDPAPADPLLADPMLTDPRTPTADDGASVAAALTQDFGDVPPPPPAPARPGEEPADGVAPPIDWSQPFG